MLLVLDKSAKQHVLKIETSGGCVNLYALFHKGWIIYFHRL